MGYLFFSLPYADYRYGTTQSSPLSPLPNLDGDVFPFRTLSMESTGHSFVPLFPARARVGLYGKLPSLVMFFPPRIVHHERNRRSSAMQDKPFSHADCRSLGPTLREAPIVSFLFLFRSFLVLVLSLRGTLSHFHSLSVGFFLEMPKVPKPFPRPLLRARAVMTSKTTLLRPLVVKVQRNLSLRLPRCGFDFPKTCSCFLL